MQTDHHRPTGRRKITRQMIEARAARPASWDTHSKGQVLGAFKRAAPALRVPRRVVDLIDYLVGFSKDCDWEFDARPVAWPSNAAIEDYLGLGRTQVKYLLRCAREHGLVEAEESGNGHRYGWRDASGRIVDACGIDLSPLAARHDEFKAAAAEHASRRREGKRLRGRITGLRNQVMSLADFAIEDGRPGDWLAVKDRARDLASLRGAGYEPERLALIVADLEELLAGANDALEGQEAVHTDPMGSENRPSITTTNPPTISNGEVRGADGPSRPEVIPFPNSNLTAQARQAANPQDSGQGQRRGADVSALRGFRVSPEFLMRIAPPLEAAALPGRAPSWGGLSIAAESVRRTLGISPSAWHQALAIFGQQEAIVVLAVIAARHATGKVGSAGGLLRRMVELHVEGRLRLDRTLFGLADGAGEPRH